MLGSLITFLSTRDSIVVATVAVVGAVVAVALLVALARAIREQLRAERPPRERPLADPPPAPRDDPSPPALEEGTPDLRRRWQFVVTWTESVKTTGPPRSRGEYTDWNFLTASDRPCARRAASSSKVKRWTNRVGSSFCCQAA